MNLPKQVGAWTRPDAPRRVTADSIFDYMDGGGELYLGYRFDHLDVFEYQAADASLGTVLVELYWMKDPDDAFGLLSTDWTGEPVAIDKTQGLPTSTSGSVVPPHRALYGAGLLRLSSGSLYARVLASRETAASREAVITIGHALASGRPSGPPRLLAAVPRDLAALNPGTPGSRIPLRADRTCFFRSYLVLNSQYFLASQDILGLNSGVSAVTTEYAPGRQGGRPTRLVFVRYESPAAASAAANTFRQAYLPEAAKQPGRSVSGATLAEHGWVAWSVSGPGLALVFDADTAATARSLADRVASAIASPEAKRP